MDIYQDVFLEISDSGNFIKLEPIEFIKYNSDMDWDKNWIRTKVSVQGGSFAGNYLAEFMTQDLEKFKQEVIKLYDNLNGYATFYDLDGHLELKIKGDGIGHFETEVKACDKPGIYKSTLLFTLNFDQTIIKRLVSQLNLITEQFPIIGKL